MSSANGRVWTAARVAAALMLAYRELPRKPLLAVDGQVETLGCDPPIEPLAWKRLISDDPDGWRCLSTWASCKAKRESFAEQVRLWGWAPATAERWRRRAAATLAVRLSGEIRLDNDKTGTGSSFTDARDAVLARLSEATSDHVESQRRRSDLIVPEGRHEPQSSPSARSG